MIKLGTSPYCQSKIGIILMYQLTRIILMYIRPHALKDWNKLVESEFFAIFPIEVTKTSIATNCDHSKNYVQMILNLQDFSFENQLRWCLIHLDFKSRVKQRFRS